MTKLAPRRIVRSATSTDRAAILEIARASGLFPPEGLDDIADEVDVYLAGPSKNQRWVLAETEAGAAAVAYYAPEAMTDGTWNLYLLAVHPDHQHAGLGTTLVRHVETELREDGARVLLIETSGLPDFADQRHFYAGLGYIQEARVRDFYALDDDKIIYWKRLVQ